MTRQLSKGTCTFCHLEYGKAAMTRHLATCKQRTIIEEQQNIQTTSAFHLLVQGTYSPMYWLHLNVIASATLATLDQFFRDIWLECCDHLSDFEIDHTRYVVEAGIDPWNHRQKNMSVRLNTVFHPGQTCSYSYDFGSTTNLTIKVIAEQEVPITEKIIRILARNTLPFIPCDLCDAPAIFNCLQCLQEESDEGWLCQNCAKKHEASRLQPIANSPRVGVCGYTGPNPAFIA